MNYIRHNFSYVLCSFSHAKCSFRGIWKKQTILALPKSFERCMLLVDCIRYICRGVWHTPITPPHKPRRKLPAQYRKSVQFRAYGIRPYGGAVMRKRNACQGNWKCAKCRGVWHTPITPPHEPRRKLPAQYRKSVQFRAYAIRPYGGSGYAETQCMPRELEMREM